MIAVDRLICACATNVVPEGEGVRRDISAHGITNKPLEVVGNGNIAGVDTVHFDPLDHTVVNAASSLRITLGIGPRDFVIGFIGRLNRDKGLKEMVAAFTEVADRAKMDALNGRLWLLCVGDPDMTAPIPSETMARMASDPNIIMAGWQHDTRPYLGLMDVLVLPSYREGFPNVLLQGSAMCLPVIATDINGSNEIVVPGETGWLVPVHDVEALTTVMRTLLGLTRCERAQIGANGRARVEGLYTQSIVRNALLDLYLRLSYCVNNLRQD